MPPTIPSTDRAARASERVDGPPVPLRRDRHVDPHAYPAVVDPFIAKAFA